MFLSNGLLITILYFQLILGQLYFTVVDHAAPTVGPVYLTINDYSWMEIRTHKKLVYK